MPLIERDWLTHASTAGLIALSGAQHGDVGRALLQGRSEQSAQALNAWLERFGDRYYLEVQRVGAPGEDLYVPAALALARTPRVPAVATNDVRFLLPTDFDAHEARVCIHEAGSSPPGAPRRGHRSSFYAVPSRCRGCSRKRRPCSPTAWRLRAAAA